MIIYPKAYLENVTQITIEFLKEKCNEKIREIYQEYDRYIVYNVYNQDKEFLYRETKSKIKSKIDINKEQDNGS